MDTEHFGEETSKKLDPALETGRFARVCVANGGKRGSRKGQKGKGPASRAKGKGKPKGVGAQGRNGNGEKGANFGFRGVCNSCGGWGHRQADCLSVCLAGIRGRPGIKWRRLRVGPGFSGRARDPGVRVGSGA